MEKGSQPQKGNTLTSIRISLMCERLEKVSHIKSIVEKYFTIYFTG
jgi:hypothetical protein